MFNVMGTIFPIFFIIIFGIFIFTIVKNIGEWHSNNQQPILNVDAIIVAKRSHTSHDNHNHNGQMHSSSSTRYYITFQVQSGDRMEFKVPSKEYGMLVEKDRGNLIFQGTRYHGFDREI